MDLIKTIMVAVDFSDHASSAADYAAKLASDVNANVLLVNILNQRDVDAMNMVAVRVPKYPVKQYIEEQLEDRHDRLKEIESRPGFSGLNVRRIVKTGVPYDALLKVIKDEKPDLLIMGTLGRSAMMDAIVGSCARKMFRHCPIPLLSIREPENSGG